MKKTISRRISIALVILLMLGCCTLAGLAGSGAPLLRGSVGESETDSTAGETESGNADKAFIAGDIDGDKVVTAADARLALRAAIRLDKLGNIQTKAADVDQDGTVTAADARSILRFAVKLDTVFAKAESPSVAA